MDRYSKAILTIIAFALCVLAFENFTGAGAQAEQGVAKVAVCDVDGKECARVSGGYLFVVGH